MFMVNQLAGFGAGGAIVPATISYTAQAVDSVDRTSYPFSSQAIGTAAANRRVVVGVAVQNNKTVGSMTIGGVSASLVVAATDSFDTNNRVEIWAAAVPTGTTADVVVNISGGTAVRCGIGVWAIYGASASASDTASDDSTPNAPVIAIPAGGVCIGIAIGQGTFSWTNLTENFDATTEGSATYSGASDEFATAQTSLTITADASSSDQVTVAASWGPA